MRSQRHLRSVSKGSTFELLEIQNAISIVTSVIEFLGLLFKGQEA